MSPAAPPAPAPDVSAAPAATPPTVEGLLAAYESLAPPDRDRFARHLEDRRAGGDDGEEGEDDDGPVPPLPPAVARQLEEDWQAVLAGTMPTYPAEEVEAELDAEIERLAATPRDQWPADVRALTDTPRPGGDAR